MFSPAGSIATNLPGVLTTADGRHLPTTRYPSNDGLTYNYHPADPADKALREALDADLRAQHAQRTADHALTVADSAQLRAQDATHLSDATHKMVVATGLHAESAQRTADQASQHANAAQSIALEAVETASDAKNIARTADVNATRAASVAQQADQQVQEVRRVTQNLAREAADIVVEQAKQKEKTAHVHGIAERAMDVAANAANTSSQSAAHYLTLQKQLAGRGAELEAKTEELRRWRTEMEQRMNDKFHNSIRLAYEEARQSAEAIARSAALDLKTQSTVVAFDQCRPAADAPSPARVESVVPVLPYPDVPPAIAVKLPSAPSPSGHLSAVREPDAEVSLGHSVPRPAETQPRPVHVHPATPTELLPDSQQAEKPRSLTTTPSRTTPAREIAPGVTTPLVAPNGVSSREATRVSPIFESTLASGGNAIRASSPETFGREAMNRKESETSASFEDRVGQPTATHSVAAVFGGAVGHALASTRTQPSTPLAATATVAAAVTGLASAAIPLAHRIRQEPAQEHTQDPKRAESVPSQGRQFESAHPGTEYTFAAGSTSRSAQTSTPAGHRYHSAASDLRPAVDARAERLYHSVPSEHLLHQNSEVPVRQYKPETSLSNEVTASGSTTRVITGGVLPPVPRAADSPAGPHAGGNRPRLQSPYPHLSSGGDPTGGDRIPPNGGTPSAFPNGGTRQPSSPLPPNPPNPSGTGPTPPPPNPPSGAPPLPGVSGVPNTPGHPPGGVHHVLVQEASKQGWKRGAGKPFSNHHGPEFWQELKTYTLQVGVGLTSAGVDPTIHGQPLTVDGAIGVITTRLDLTHQGLTDHETQHAQNLADFTDKLKKPFQLHYAEAEGYVPGDGEDLQHFINGHEYWEQATNGYGPTFTPLLQRGKLIHHHPWSYRYLFAMTRISEDVANVGFTTDGSDAVGFTLAVTATQTGGNINLRRLKLRVDEFLVLNLNAYYLQHLPRTQVVGGLHHLRAHPVFASRYPFADGARASRVPAEGSRRHVSIHDARRRFPPVGPRHGSRAE